MSGFEIELPSSPDPLGEDGDEGDDAPPPPPSARVPPSTTRRPPSTTRRLLQSNASSRFSALPGTSPRKRMFALDVGTEITPQTIFVTVEAGQDGNPIIPKGAVGSSVRRRLFGSPTPSQTSPQRRIKTTTTTVPLRGLTDDEGDPTPRRRRRSSGRPGTPATASAKTTKKKKGTPTPKAKATRKPRGTPTNPSSDILLSEPPTGPAEPERPTPAKRRGRPPKRKSTDPASELGDPNTVQTLPRKRGRKVRESLGPDQLALLSATNDDGAAPADDGLGPSTISDVPGLASDELAAEQDIWMATTSDTPAGKRQQILQGDEGMGFSEAAEVPYSENEPPELDDQGFLPGESDDFAPMMDYDDRSDVGSETQPEAQPQDDELEDQGPLPGESNDYAPIMNHVDRNENRHENGAHDAELGDQRYLRDESDNIDQIMDHKETSGLDPRHQEKQPDSGHDATELEDQGPLPGESDGYAPMMDHDDRSDVRSEQGERPDEGAEGGSDYTVDPDTFTMIGIESTSFRASKNIPTSEAPEMGDETSMFINKTLDSLRQEIAASDDDEVDILMSRGNTPVEAEAERPAAAIPSPRSKSHLPQSPANQSARYSSRSPGRTESEPASIARLVPRYYEPSLAQPILGTGPDSPHSEGNGLIDDEDSFSDIPEEVLAAAGSQDDWQPSKGPTLEQLNWAASITRQNVAETGYGQFLGSVSRQTGARLPSSQSTPSQSNLSLTDPDATISQRSVSHSAQSRRASGQATQRSSPPHSARSRADSNRLLTPDDTTSSSAGVQSPGADQPLHREEERPTIVSDDIGSSPPQITTFVEDGEQPVLPVRRNSDTPANQQPEIQVEHVQERHTIAAVQQPALQHVQPVGLRPTLSPVKRIGRTLQNILSDPPSPSARSSVLGSPFKGSGRNSSPLDGAAVDEALRNATSPDNAQQSRPSRSEPQVSEPLAQSSAKSWAMSFAPLSQIKNLVTQGAQLFTSPQVSSSQVLEDPFGPSSPTAEKSVAKSMENNGGSAFMDRIREASREDSIHSSRTSRRAVPGGGANRTASVFSATRNSGMDQNRSPIHRMVAAGSSQRNAQTHVRISTGYDGAYDEDADELAGDEPGEEPPRDDEQQSEDEHMAEAPEPRQSLDTEAAQDEMQVDENEENDEPQLDDAPAGGEESEEEDIWAVEANRTASSPQPFAPENELSSLFRKSELSVDWGTSTNSQRSARPVKSPVFQPGRSVREHPPENLEDYSLVDLHSGTSTQPSAKKPTPQAQDQPRRVDLSDFFSSSPNFMERQRRAKEASLAKSAAQKAAANASRIDSPPKTMTAQVQQAVPSSLKPLLPFSQLVGKLPTPAPGASENTTRESTSHMSSTPERPEVSRAAEKEITPQRRRNDAALFETWSASSSRPPTVQVPSSDLCSNPRPSTPQDLTESSFDTPELRPLPARAASPSKSCLRSPLKPRTPGRVVEFTSSTASATAPFQVNVGSQNKAPVAPASNPFTSVPTFPGKENQLTSLDDDTNHRSPQNKHLRQAPQRQQQQQKVDSSLSQTRWTRRHWLRLDELLQTHRRSPLEFELRHADALMASPRRRPSSRLLGKQVTSQGEAMVLEQWHLDVADAFKKEVGGWAEDVLAKRLFALIVGEERRRSGLVPRSR